MPSSLALPAASSSPSLPCYGGSRPEPRRAATARAPMPLAGSGKLVGEREKEPGETAAAAAAESRCGGMRLEIDGMPLIWSQRNTPFARSELEVDGEVVDPG
uniref:Uncharacterized protein n=1 Tax=Oryza glumipatula TaxID=40148 RepID=A0A0E0ATJ1_9ORYZ